MSADVLRTRAELELIASDRNWADALVKECDTKLRAHFRAAGIDHLEVGGLHLCTTQAVYDVTDPHLVAKALCAFVRSGDRNVAATGKPEDEECAAVEEWLRRMRSDGYAAMVGALPAGAAVQLKRLVEADASGGLARRAARKPTLGVRATAPDAARCVVLGPETPALPEWELDEGTPPWDEANYAETDEDHAAVQSGEAWERD